MDSFWIVCRGDDRAFRLDAMTFLDIVIQNDIDDEAKLIALNQKGEIQATLIDGVSYNECVYVRNWIFITRSAPMSETGGKIHIEELHRKWISL